MSELKSYDLVDIQDYRGEVYLKSEADKVIAELEESHKMEVEQLLMEIVELKDKALQYKVLDKEHCRDLNTQERHFALQIAHNKYKRCLAMAWWCERKRIDAAYYRIPREKWDFYGKWNKIWLILAEKFNYSER